MVFIIYICFSFLYVGCKAIRMIPCKELLQDQDIKLPASFSDIMLDHANSPFMLDSLFYLDIMLPDSLKGNKVSGWAYVNILFSPEGYIQDIQPIWINIKNDKWGSLYYDYIPSCQKKPLKSKYHEKLMNYLKTELSKRPISQIQSFFETEHTSKNVYFLPFYINISPLVE